MPVTVSGMIVAYAGNEIPEGWLECDGRVVSRTEPHFRDLFNAIGTLHGGDGEPQFQIPDYRGRFLRGVSHDSGNDPDAGTRQAPGYDGTGNCGNVVGSIQDSGVGPHTHHYSGAVMVASGGHGFRGVGMDSNSYAGSGGPYSTSVPVSGTSDTRPNNAYVTFIIKL